MKAILTNHLDAFRGQRVLVVGEAMLDCYLEGDSSRLCPEAPVPVVAVAARRDAAGGAANTAVNLRALGADVTFLSIVGDDAEAQYLGQCLNEQGVETDHLLVQAQRRTLSKHRVCAGGQILVRFDQGDTGPTDEHQQTRLLERLRALFFTCDAVIVSDYGYGVLSPAVIETLAHLQKQSPRVFVVDSKRLPAYRAVGSTAVKPNYAEALQLLGLGETTDQAHRAAFILRHEQQLLELTGSRLVAVTLDREGAVVLERDRVPYRTLARPAAGGCPSGAGDTFLAAFTLALAAGADSAAAAEIASAAAAIVVAKEGTAVCSGVELRESLTTEDFGALTRFRSPDRSRLSAELADHRRRGRRIVFTNGCFDILHRGHVTYLRRARELGDVLVVGVNSDASIRRLKGPTRPINTLEDRLTVLAALRFVDYLIPFEEDTPHELIRLVRPDIFVKGGDYTRERLPEASLVEELGGVVRILPLVESRSTTSMIDRIRSTHTVPGPALSLVNGLANS